MPATSVPLRRDILQLSTRGTKSVRPAPMSAKTTEVRLNYHLRHTFIQKAENRAIEKTQTERQLGGVKG